MRSGDADIAACRHMLRAGSRSFAAAALLLPRRVREPATALYAFCRLADDMVDLGGDREGAIARLRDRLERVYAQRPLDAAPDRAFAAVVARHGIPRALPEGLLDGLEWDAEGRRYEDLSGLYDYAARVAGTVGAMMTLVMGRREPEVLGRAFDLGAAMQLTNIARDVGEDARAGRLYLPVRWLCEAGIDPDAWLARPVFSPALGGVIQRLLDSADRLYGRADAGIPRLPRSCRPGIRAARLIYAEIGTALRNAGLDAVSARTVVPARRKAVLLAAAAAPAPAASGAGVPAMPEVTGFIDAVTAGSCPAPPATADRAGPIGQRLIWVIELFERLERRDRMTRSLAN